MPTIKNETTAIDKTFKYNQYHVTVLLKNCNLGKQLQTHNFAQCNSVKQNV